MASNPPRGGTTDSPEGNVNWPVVIAAFVAAAAGGAVGGYLGAQSGSESDTGQQQEASTSDQ